MKVPIRIVLTLVLCLVFTANAKAQDVSPVKGESPADQSSESVPEQKPDVQQEPVAAKPTETSRSFFSWPWFGICVLVAGTAFFCGTVRGKQESDFSTILLDSIVACLPEDSEIEYEFLQISPGQVKFIVRVLLKQDGPGKLTTQEQELKWNDLPDAIRAEFIRSKRQNQVYSLKKGTSS